MPKIKTKKSAAKRFKITGTGRIFRDQTKHRHLLECKPSGKKRLMGNKLEVSKTDLGRIRKMLPGI